MSYVDLGSGIQTPSRLDDPIELLRAEIRDEILAEVRLVLARVLTPIVNVAAAPAPNVIVNAAEMPEMGPMSCTVDMPGIDRLVTILSSIETLLRTPVTRTVQRGSDGTITTITERRA